MYTERRGVWPLKRPGPGLITHKGGRQDDRGFIETEKTDADGVVPGQGLRAYEAEGAGHVAGHSQEPEGRVEGGSGYPPVRGKDQRIKKGQIW